jgi:cytochrome d ubiquinol oxidase subunit II
MAYGIVMPALYIPVTLMLIALIFRGVAFEFRFKSEPNNRYWWDLAFMLGSIFAAFSQGLILGGLVQGIAVEGRSFAGTPWDWLSAFSIVTGVALVAGYALLGTGWLIMKCEGELQQWAFRVAKYCLIIVLFFMAAVSIWMPVLHSDLNILGAGFNAYMQSQIFQRWFTAPNIYFLAPVPLAVLGLALYMLNALEKGREYAPFVASVALFALGFAGLAVSLWPNIVPPKIDLWEAAAVPMSQGLLLVGVVVLLPVILGYTAYIYWVFRGKVNPDAGYH